FFSPSATQIPLQTSTFQAVNGTSGAAMSLIKRSDAKNQPSTRASGILLFKSSNKPGVTGQPGNQSTEAKGTVPVPFADRGSQAPAAAMSTLPTDVANDREASAPSTRSGKP